MKTTGVVELFAAVGIGLATVGCGPERESVGHSMQSVDAASRVQAIQRAAVEADSSALANLVDRLDDEDAAVRFVALMALERITGERFGYRYGASAEQRGPATARWRTYLKEQAREEVSHVDTE